MRSTFIIAAAMLLTTAVLAQEEPQLTDLAACRIDDQTVKVSFKFESSPCWAPSDPTVSTRSETPVMTVETTRTAEICTMNIGVADYENTISLPAEANTLTVRVNNPEGKLIGTGMTKIAEHGKDCKPAK